MSLNLPFGVRVATNLPVDADRYIATDIAARDRIITDGRSYVGLQVYVESEDVLYLLKSGNTWDIISIGGISAANNGLTLNSGEIKLGGPITESTIFEGNDQIMSFGTTNNRIANINFNLSDDFNVSHVGETPQTSINVTSTNGSLSQFYVVSGSNEDSIEYLRGPGSIYLNANEGVANGNCAYLRLDEESNTTSIGVESSTFNYTSIDFNGGGVKVNDSILGLGLNYSDYTIDEANIDWPTDDNHIPSIGMIKANTLASDRIILPLSPDLSVTEDGRIDFATYENAGGFAVYSYDKTVNDYDGYGTFSATSFDAGVAFYKGDGAGNNTDTWNIVAEEDAIRMTNSTGFGAKFFNSNSYINVDWSTDDDHIPSIGMIKENVSSDNVYNTDGSLTSNRQLLGDNKDLALGTLASPIGELVQYSTKGSFSFNLSDGSSNGNYPEFHNVSTGDSMGILGFYGHRSATSVESSQPYDAVSFRAGSISSGNWFGFYDYKASNGSIYFDAADNDINGWADIRLSPTASKWFSVSSRAEGASNARSTLYANTSGGWVFGDNEYGKANTDVDGDGENKLVDCDDSDAFLNLDDLDGDGYTT